MAWSILVLILHLAFAKVSSNDIRRTETKAININDPKQTVEEVKDESFQSLPESANLFGCPYHNIADYSLDLPEHQKDFSVWGDKADAISFEHDFHFESFYALLEMYRKDVRTSCIVNTMEPFVQMFHDFQESKKSFDDFYADDYLPFYPKSDRSSNYISCLLNFYDKLSDKFPNMADSFVLSSGDLDVTAEFLEEVTKTKETPMFLLKNEYLAGVIHIDIAGSAGYIVIHNMSSPATVLMVDPEHQKHSPETTRFGKTYTFSLRGLSSTESEKSNDVFIYVQSYRKSASNQSGSKILDNMLLYADRSLCSFVRTVEKKMLLLERSLTISAFSEDGLYRAYSSVKRDNPYGVLTVGLEGTPEEFSRQAGADKIWVRYLQIAGKKELESVSAVSEALGYGKHDLYETLKSLNDIWTNHSKFLQDIVRVDKIVRESPPSPSLPLAKPLGIRAKLAAHALIALFDILNFMLEMLFQATGWLKDAFVKKGEERL